MARSTQAALLVNYYPLTALLFDNRLLGQQPVTLNVQGIINAPAETGNTVGTKYSRLDQVKFVEDRL